MVVYAAASLERAMPLSDDAVGRACVGDATYHLNSRISALGGWPNSSFTEAGSS